ncbi:MAG: hypothetical protein HC927_04170 [Deltaproteobacteria bacterium]|nr:hypothetical protein [Deltaproteobacteria bacterium]
MSPELVREGTELVEGLVRDAIGEDGDQSDVELISAMLVGAVVSRATLGRGCDVEFIAGCVDFVVGGAV